MFACAGCMTGLSWSLPSLHQQQPACKLPVHASGFKTKLQERMESNPRFKAISLKYTLLFQQHVSFLAAFSSYIR